MSDFIAHRERFATVASTNDVVRGWLAAGTPEVALAVAAQQTAGRGRQGRSWVAPAGAALLLSLGFRPTWLEPARVWRLSAIAASAMSEAAEEIAGLPEGTIRLKWPNDLVVEGGDGIRKLAGVLGETDGLGTTDPRVVVGIGVDTDWAATDFPADLAGTMTSLRVLAGDRPIDGDALLNAFLAHLEIRVGRLRDGQFDATAWMDRQLTTGRDVELVAPDGSRTPVRATGVDPESGGLLVQDPTTMAGERTVVSGEIRHVRLADHRPVSV